MGRGGLGLGGRGFGRRRRYREASLGSVLLVGVGFLIFFAVESRSAGERTAERPPPIRQVASIIELGGPALPILQRLGSPSCRERVDDGERMIFARVDAPADGCTAKDGDLVVVVREERIVRFTPEYGRSREVRDGNEMAEFRRWYATNR